MWINVNFSYLMGLVRLILWFAVLFLNRKSLLFDDLGFMFAILKVLFVVRQFRIFNFSLNCGTLKLLEIVDITGDKHLQSCTRSLCDHFMLFCAGFCMLLNKGNVKRVKTNYYWYCKFLLYLPRSFRNRRLISIYQATDIVLSVEKLNSKLIDDVPIRLGPNHHLIRLFC